MDNYCRKCGEKLQEGDNFCPNCGVRLNSIKNESIVENHSPVTEPAKEMNESNKNNVLFSMQNVKEKNKDIPLKYLYQTPNINFVKFYAYIFLPFFLPFNYYLISLTIENIRIYPAFGLFGIILIISLVTTIYYFHTLKKQAFISMFLVFITYIIHVSLFAYNLKIVNMPSETINKIFETPSLIYIIIFFYWFRYKKTCNAKGIMIKDIKQENKYNYFIDNFLIILLGLMIIGFIYNLILPF